jgi:hypothetical protein
VEQYWRDNRLNMIHEGTHGIQAADLLGRKVVMEGGKGLHAAGRPHQRTIERAIQQPALAEHANALGQALQKVGAATKAAWATGNPADALANAVPYMQAFGHLVIAWTWLDVLLALPATACAPRARRPAARGPLLLPLRIAENPAWLRVVETRDPTCATMPEEAF